MKVGTGGKRLWLSRKQGGYLLQATGSIALSCVAATNPALAQIVSDGTLSTTITTPNNLNFTITGGNRAEANLFHSFSEFSLPAGGSAFFNNAPEIQNIISRVTGSSPSAINGLLQANGTANLFLINPNGILFGPNARLDIGGSFVATTANAIQFGDQGFFSASTSDVPPLLTVNPSAFLFNQITTASITNQSVARNLLNNNQVDGLQVPNGRSLLLVGGAVNLDGGYLTALGGRVELGGVAGSGTVGLNVNENNLRLNFPDRQARADVFLNGSQVNVIAGGSGSIAINAQNLNISGSRLFAGIAPGLGSVGSQAGDITLDATGAITIAGALPSSIINTVGENRSRAFGNAGNILIEAASLSTNNARLDTATFGEGNAGDIVVQVNGSVSLADNTVISSRVGQGALGNGGDIYINAESLSLTDSGLSTTSRGGEAGAVFIGANGFVSLANSSISTATEPRATGNSGDINIHTGTLALTDGTRLFTRTSGMGRSGNVIIEARDTVSIADSVIFSDTLVGQGDGGDIEIVTRLFSLTDASLYAITSGQGDAGNIQIEASDSVSVSRVNPDPARFRSIGLFTSTTADGNAGNLAIATAQLSVRTGARISASTSGRGQGGRLSVTASDSVELIGTSADGSPSGLFTETRGSGTASNLTISTGQLVVRDRAQASVSSTTSEAAGNLEITALSIQLNNEGSLSAQTALGNGGNIALHVQDLLLLRDRSNISTDAGTEEAGGDGGNMEINAPLIVAIPSENSDITANAYEGRGGNIRIATQGIFGIQFREQETPESDITASSQFGVDGVVEIITPDVDPSRGLVTVPVQLVDASRLVASGCGVVARQRQSKFIITGRGGLPPNPSELLSSDTVWSDLRLPVQQAETRSSSVVAMPPTNSTAVSLVEAQGWVIDDKGEVVLTASPPAIASYSSGLTTAECDRY